MEELAEGGAASLPSHFPPVRLVISWLRALHPCWAEGRGVSFYLSPLFCSRNPSPPFPHSCSGHPCSMGCDLSNRD